MPRDFRFGVNLIVSASRTEWVAKCRRAEELGFDVLLFSDHVGQPAPFSSMVMAAEATQRPRVGTFMINVAFWNPTLLAREVGTAYQLTDGRLELGLGAGYAKTEFEEIGLPWEKAGVRVDRLEQTVAAVSRLLAGPPPEFEPSSSCKPAQWDEYGHETPASPVPPLMIGGAGPRVLRLAATQADTVSFAGTRISSEGPPTLAGSEEIAEQVALVDRHAAGREIEKSIVLYSVVQAKDRHAAAGQLRDFRPDLSPDELLELPTLLTGSPRAMAEQLEHQRERYGFSYITVLEPSMEAFAPVIAELR